MAALDRLKEQVKAWKERIAELEEANRTLEAQAGQAGDGVDDAAETLRAELAACRQHVRALEQDIADKDIEIEAIIAKVEALIG